MGVIGRGSHIFEREGGVGHTPHPIDVAGATTRMDAVLPRWHPRVGACYTITPPALIIIEVLCCIGSPLGLSHKSS